MKSIKDHLDTYTRACRDIELSNMAIGILADITGEDAVRCIKIMEFAQQKMLREIKKTSELIVGSTPDPLKGMKECQCGVTRSTSKLSLGFGKNNKQVWFCDECLPL